MERCPCCGLPTLKVRHEYEICQKCQWEDEPIAEDKPSFANGGATLLQWRASYQDAKQNLDHRSIL